MLVYRRTSLLESSAQTLVNTVNCVGVMGKGIAKEFKTREPNMFVAYKKLCNDKLLSPGKLWLWRGTEFWTLNFPTKMHWRNPSRIEWIDSGLKKFVAGYEKLGIREISFPRLGCGNGGLDWDEVKPLMESYLRGLPIEVYIHDFTVDVGLPEHLQAIASKLRTEQTEDPTFAAFVEDIRKAVLLAGSELLDLTSERPFSASMNADVLEIKSIDGSWTFEVEDLRGLWANLQRGLLTEQKASWSAIGSGRYLLSVLSLLPQVRPVEIQVDKREPELAVEWRPFSDTAESAPISHGQLAIKWH